MTHRTAVRARMARAAPSAARAPAARPRGARAIVARAAASAAAAATAGCSLEHDGTLPAHPSSSGAGPAAVALAGRLVDVSGCVVLDGPDGRVSLLWPDGWRRVGGPAQPEAPAARAPGPAFAVVDTDGRTVARAGAPLRLEGHYVRPDSLSLCVDPSRAFAVHGVREPQR
ncbi:MAG: hypothetical protein LCI03_08445 [Actinobacteria bacterium]|nr:hypothetical protein [Actinomycetota bacterium]